MKQNKISKLVILCCTILGLIVFCAVSYDRIYNRWGAARGIKGGTNNSVTLEKSKKNRTFLWEYEIPQKEIYYEDSIRKIHIVIEYAFAERDFSYERGVPNFIDFRDNDSQVIVKYKYYGDMPDNYNLPSPFWHWEVKFAEKYIGSARGFMYIDYEENYSIDDFPPDTVQLHIIAHYNEREPLQDSGDTLAVINLYKIKNNDEE